MTPLSYSIAIATRNRLDALKLSIPLMLNQSRPPSQLIVVDSSDNHEPVKELVQSLTDKTPLDTIVYHSPKGLTRQRNKALEYVTHPIVFFPDDDSIWFNNTAELQMEVYERDTDNQISAVCGAESKSPPFEFESTKAAYKMNLKDRVKLHAMGLLRSLEQRFAPDPARIAGRSFYKTRSIPNWAQTEEIFPVEYMTGFRMSFRTSVIKAHKFDEALSNYSLCEDIDASFSAWREGAVIGVRNAKIFHFKSPESRGNGRQIGITQILNKCYIISKHTPPEHAARHVLTNYSKSKIFRYRLDTRNKFGRERLKGARAASLLLHEFMRCTPLEAKTLYLKHLKSCL